MSPEQLLEKLYDLGTIETRILDKIRKEIENPDKNVKPKKILAYLVKKGELTEKQAARLLKAKPTEDEIQVIQPVEEKRHDTNDLMNFGAEDLKTEAAPVVDHGATMDHNDVVEEEKHELIEVQPFVAPEIEPVELDPIQPADMLDMGYDAGAPVGFDDGGLNDAFGSGAYASADSGEQKTVKLGFSGKKDKSDQWSTKWLYIGFGILGTILILTAVLWIANLGQKPEDMFEAAMNSYNNQSYGDATKKFEEYLDIYPNHKDSKTARALKVNSILRSTYGLKNWPEVIQQADVLLPPLAEEEENKMDQIREDLGVMLPRCLVEISNKSKKVKTLGEMEKELEKVTKYKSIIDNPVYIPGSIRKKPSIADNLSKIDNNIRTIQGQIDKEEEYNSALAEITNLRGQGKTDDAFGTFRKLKRNYGDVAGRKELRELMLTISAKESELVQAVQPEIMVSDQPANSLIENTVVLAAKSGEVIESLKDEIVPFLADGSVYGIDAGEGEIAWRHFVGFETNIQPVQIDNETLVISSSLTDEIIAVQPDTGIIKWRAEIGEGFMEPVVGDGILIVTTESAKVIELSSETGQIQKAIKLPQRTTNVGAMIAERNPYIYQPGFYSNIYVLSNQDLSCKEVFHLGHYEGSIAIPPQPWVGYILVAVNGGDYCDLHVLKPEENSSGLRLVQSFSRITSGPVSSPFKRLGRLMMLASDNGEMRILELNPIDEDNPVRIFANDLFEAKGGLQSYFHTDGSNLWVAGKGFMRYRIRRNEGKFAREVITEGTDTFISQIHKLDDYIMHVRRRYRSGMLSVSVSDAKTLKPIWRTDFAGQIAGAPLKFGDNVVAVSNQGDMFSVDSAAVEKGYSDNAVRSSTVVQDLQFKNVIPVGNETFACVGPPDRKDFLFAKGTTGESKLMALAPPADKPACRPLALGEFLIVPSESGHVVRVDPRNGRRIATFQPPIKPGTVTPWFEPTQIQGNVFAVAMGIAEGVDRSKMFLLEAGDSRSIKELSSLDTDFPFKSRLINDGNSIFAVMDADDNDKLAAISASQPLTLQSEVALEGSVIDGPWLTEAGILVKLDNDEIACYATDLSLKWSVAVGNVNLASSPEVVGSQLMLPFQNGVFKMLNSSTGEEINQFDVGQPIIHRPLIDQQKMYLSGLDGTLHVIDLNRLSQ